jgi:AcrR family transcriptional regulator
MRIKKDDRRVKYTKMVLRDSLMKLLAEKDISRITIKEICENADINRATFYAHYTDQYDLLDKIENELFDNLRVYLGKFDRPARPATTPNGAPRWRWCHIFDYLKENVALCKLLLNESGNWIFKSAS